MVKAYVMITVAIGYIHKVIENISLLENVERVETVSGPCDIILVVKTSDLHELKEFLMVGLRSIDGIMECSTSLVIEP